MTDMTTRAGFTIDSRLASFLEAEVLGPLGRDVEAFWHRLAALLAEFAPRNAALLAKREALQAQIDAWHVERAGKPHDPVAYKAFLESTGYLVPEPGDFQIGTLLLASIGGLAVGCFLLLWSMADRVQR